MLLASAPAAAALAPCARRARALPIAALPAPRAARRLSTAPRAAHRQAVAAAGADLAAAKVIVQGRGLEVTPALKEHAQSKVQKAVQYFEGDVKEVDVKLSATGGHGRGGEAHAARAQTAEVTVYTLRHGVVRVEDTEADLYAAVDLVADKLRRKLQRVKEKAAARGTWPGRGGPRGGPGLPGALADAGEGDGAAEGVGALPSDGGAAAAAPREGIVREKVLFLEASMSADEAVDRLEAVGHDFFVFSDVADGAVKVVYRRKSAGYGLLIPQA